MMINIFKTISIAVALTIVGLTSAMGQRCEEINFWSGSEPVIDYGVDTTGVAWVLSEPFTERYKLKVGDMETQVYEKLSPPVISPDGFSWAAIGVLNNLMNIIINGEEYPLRYNNAEGLKFSGDGVSITFIGSIAEEKYIVIYGPDDPYEDPEYREYEEVRRSEMMISPSGDYYVSPNATRWAYIGKRGSDEAIVVNNKEVRLAETIVPIGFLWDGEFAYAARNGTTWQVYHGDEQVGGIYNNIFDAQVNRFGTAAAFIGAYQQGAVAVLMAEEYSEPLVSNTFDQVMNLALAPEGPMMAFQAVRNAIPFVVYGRAEYQLEQESEMSKPMFTAGAASMVFLLCRNACFLTIDGTRQRLEHPIEPGANFAVTPSGKSIGLATGVALSVQQIGKKERFASRMMDEMRPCVYNWREKTFDAMGKMGNTIFLLRCKSI